MASQLSAKLSLDVKGFEQGMQDAKQSTEQYQTQLGDLSKKFPSMRKEMAQTKKAVMDMEVAWRSMSDAQKKSFEGQELQRQLQTLKERGAELKDAIMDVNQEMKNMASDTRQLDAVKQGFDVLGNSISLAANAYAAFTGDSEDAKRALTIFAGVQSTVNTLTALQNALQEQSSFMLGITTMQQKLKTKAVELDTAAQGKNIVATKGATAAQWALNLAADANPYVLLASAIAALVAGYVIYKDEINELLGIQSKEKTTLNEVSDEFKNQTKTLGDNMVKVKSLQLEWNELRTEGEKQQWIKDNQDEFKQLGVDINSVEDAENLLVKNTGAFIESMKLKAQAAAMMAVAATKYQKAIEAKEEVDETDIAWYEGAFTQLQQWASGKYVQSFEQIRRSKQKAQNDASDELFEAGDKLVEDAYKLEQSADKMRKDAGIATASKTDKIKSSSKKSEKTDTWSPIDMSSIKAPKIDIHFGYNQSELDKKIKKLKDQLAGIPIRLDTEIDRAKLQKEIDKLEGIKSSKSFNESLNDDFNKHLVESQKALGEAQKQLDAEEKARMEAKKKAQNDLLNNSIAMFSGMGQAMQTLGNEEAAQAMQFAATSTSMIADIAKQIPALLASTIAKGTEASASVPFPGNLAAMAAVVADIMAIFAALPKFAGGGVIEGPFHTGDRMLARVNSGEMILSNRQQRNLFDAIDNGKLQGSNNSFSVESFKVRGSDLYLTMKNYEKTTGKKL